MTNSEQTGTSSARSPYGTGSIQDGHILGVLTGQVEWGIYMGPGQELDGEMLDEPEGSA